MTSKRNQASLIGLHFLTLVHMFFMPNKLKFRVFRVRDFSTSLEIQGNGWHYSMDYALRPVYVTRLNFTLIQKSLTQILDWTSRNQDSKRNMVLILFIFRPSAAPVVTVTFFCILYSMFCSYPLEGHALSALPNSSHSLASSPISYSMPNYYARLRN